MIFCVFVIVINKSRETNQTNAGLILLLEEPVFPEPDASYLPLPYFIQLLKDISAPHRRTR